MKFETLKIGKSSNQKKVFVGVTSVSLVLLMSLSLFSYAKYKVTSSVKLAEGTLNYKPADLNLVAMYKENADGGTDQITAVPGSGYTLNTTNSKCKFNGADEDVEITYDGSKLSFSGLTKTGTKCYVYFDIVKDTTVPVIAGVTQTNTESKDSISVTVNASDDNAVTEYWYAIDGGTAVQGTGSTHTFTGLTAGSSHTISVYVKDAAGNSSTTWSGTMKTKANGISSGDIIAGNPSEAPTSKFTSAATTDEGVFKVADPMYGTNAYSYYYRGAVTNNYVKFAGFCWRIIRINGDGSIRMIYDGTSCHANGTNTAESIAKTSQAYNSSYNASYYVGYTWANAQRTQAGTASNLKTQTDSWFNTNIKGTDLEKVADGKFCNDRNTASGYTWSATPSSTFYYAARERLQTNKTPTLECPSGDVYTLKAGAITADEVSFAGGVSGTANSKYYLYNGQYYWTLSPSRWNGSRAWVFRVDHDGQLYYNNVNSTAPGVRPVINLKADTMFVAGGAGTQSNPYVVS